MERSSGSQQKDLEQAENAQHSEIGNESEPESPSRPPTATDAVSDLEGLLMGVKKNLAQINATDLIKGMHTRTATINWEEKQREALERARARFATNSWPSAAFPSYPVGISKEIAQTLQDFARNPHRESMQKEAMECMNDILNNPHWPAAIREVAGFMEDARHNPYLAAMRGETVNPVADAHPNLQEAVGNADSPENQESLPVVERDAHGLESQTSSSSGPSKNRDHQGKDETRSVEDGLEAPQGSGSSSSYSEPVPYDASLTEEERKNMKPLAGAIGKWRHENPHIDPDKAFKPQQSGCTSQYKTRWKGEFDGVSQVVMGMVDGYAEIAKNFSGLPTDSCSADLPSFTDSIKFDGGRAAKHLEMATSLRDTEDRNCLVDLCKAEHFVRSCRNPDSCPVSTADWEKIVSAAPSGSDRKGVAPGGFWKDLSEIYSVGIAGDHNPLLGDALSQNFMAQRVQQVAKGYETSQDLSDIVNKLVDPRAMSEASNGMVQQSMSSFSEVDGVTSASKKIPEPEKNDLLNRISPHLKK